MKNRLIAMLGLACVSATCVGLAACANASPITSNQKKGYTISVTYDANGGDFMNNAGVTIRDMYSPTQVASGDSASIKLLEPTDPSRKTTSASESITLSHTGYFCVGFYQSREERVDASGNKLDAFGRVLEEKTNEKDEVYYVVKGTEEKSEPGYIYGNRWDFETDRLKFTANGNKVSSVTLPSTWTVDESTLFNEKKGEIDLVLYAAWVPYFRFNYVYKTYDDNGNLVNANAQWEELGTTRFDYSVAGKNVLYTPYWDDEGENATGEMLHKLEGGFTFPSLRGVTFESAYTDANCTQKIEAAAGEKSGTHVHGGTVDMAHGTAVNPIETIYVKMLEGSRYHISNAKQFSKNANVAGIYTLSDDIVFDQTTTWPKDFANYKFTGKIFGNGHKIIGASAVQTDARNQEYGGLFSQIGAGAVIENVTFEDVVYDISTGTTRAEVHYGLLAGDVDEDAQLSGVTVSGTIRLGKINISATAYNIYAIAGGDTTGVTSAGLTVVVYGTEYTSADMSKTYQYSVDPTKVTVEDGIVKVVFFSNNKEERNQAQFVVYP